MKRIYVSTMVSAAAGIAAIGLIAGCSAGSGTSTAAATGAASSGNAAYSAYTQCLSRHGVTLPSRGAFTAGARRSHSPGAGGFTPGSRPSGGYGGFGGGFASADPSMSAAVQACASLRPTGAAGFGGGAGGFGGGSTRLAAFRSCMTQQGETVPTTRPTAAVSPAPTGDARYLDGLNPADPKVAAALNVCKALIPTGAPSAAAT
jgi:hypothetical protein